MSATAKTLKRLALLALPLLLGWLAEADSATVVTVGVYHFPPAASVQNNDEPAGLLGDLLQELEANQDTLRFRIFHTSPKRRYLDMEAGLYDVIFFESPEWGWPEHDVTMTQPILADEELYVALKKPGRDQSFFNDLTRRNIVAMAGYHYGFANFETDSSALRRKFHLEFSSSHHRNLELIKADRPSVAEVAIVSRSYLQSHLAEHPEDASKLLISDQVDQAYLLRVIARKNGPVDADDMTRLLAPLVHNGKYSQLVRSRGLQLPPDFLNRFEVP